jgi:hypothetical protein
MAASERSRDQLTMDAVSSAVPSQRGMGSPSRYSATSSMLPSGMPASTISGGGPTNMSFTFSWLTAPRRSTAGVPSATAS